MIELGGVSFHVSVECFVRADDSLPRMRHKPKIRSVPRGRIAQRSEAVFPQGVRLVWVADSWCRRQLLESELTSQADGAHAGARLQCARRSR